MSASVGPPAQPELPDLSHLTEEERSIIQAVMERQKKEEEQEQSMLKDKEEPKSPTPQEKDQPKPQPSQWNPFSGISELVSNVLQTPQRSPVEEEPKPKLHQQFEMYKDQVKKIGDEAQKVQEPKGESPICGICHKTKFADGCGHVCSYCQSKFCARCGGRVSLRSNKVMWVCNLCRKQQEILTKSGAWFYSQQPAGADGCRLGAKRTTPSPGPANQDSLKNGSELSTPIDRKRSPSASSHREGGEHTQYAPPDGSMPQSPSDYGRDPRQSPRRSRIHDGGGGYADSRGRWRSQDEPLDAELDDYALQRRREEEYQARYRSDPNLARYPVKPQPYEEQMRIHAEVSRARHERRHSDVSLAYTELDELQGGRLSRPPLTGTGPRSYSVDRSSPGQRASNHSPPTPHRSPVLGDGGRRGVGDGLRKQHHLDPSSAMRRGKPDEVDGMLRNDSLSSDQSETVRPPGNQSHRSRRTGKMRQTGSFSSSEEELATTPEYTSCEDVDLESHSVRGKRKTNARPIFLDVTYGQPERRTDGRSYEEDDAEWSEPQVKDSGVDTCSSTTLNEESSQAEKHPVTWQPSKDGERLIGRILLNKRMKDGTVPRDTGALLGLKVVGGKMTESGKLCAFITKVKRGSLADTVGHLRPGDQVIEWNGRVLQGATFKEVYNIIMESKPEPQVELVVSRPIGDVPRIPESTHGQLESSSSSFESQKMGPAISVTSPMSPGMLRDAPQYLSGQLSSPCLSRRTTPFVPRVQVKLWYDKVGHQLIVTILGAKDLPSRDDGRPRNPYVKIYFLPDRSDKSKRRTKTVKKSLEPKWNQTFMYSPVHRREFRERMLEITLWDQARVREEESEFLGEILIELETALLDDQQHWYKLQTHDLSSMPLPNPSPYMQRRLLQGESPTRRLQNKGSIYYSSGSQRISDSEFSDYDCKDGIGVISDYRHNGRDFQSSTLSVPEQVMSSNHCSRSDMFRTRSRSPSVPPPQSRSLDHGVRGGPSLHRTGRMDRHQMSEDRYSPDSRYLTLPPRNRHRQPVTDPVFQDPSSLSYPLYREDAVKLLRSTRMGRAYSEGAYGSLDRRRLREWGMSEFPERYYNGPNPVPTPWPNHMMNGTSEHYGEDHIPEFPVAPDNFEEDLRYSRGTVDRRDYHRSRSADQRPMLERPAYTRSRSTERPESGYIRSMPSLPSGRSAPTSPALSRANPRGGSVQTSPTGTPICSRRGRQLPQVPPKGGLDRSGEEVIQHSEAEVVFQPPPHPQQHPHPQPEPPFHQQPHPQQQTDPQSHPQPHPQQQPHPAPQPPSHQQPHPQQQPHPGPQPPSHPQPHPQQQPHPQPQQLSHSQPHPQQQPHPQPQQLSHSQPHPQQQPLPQPQPLSHPQPHPQQQPQPPPQPHPQPQPPTQTQPHPQPQLQPQGLQTLHPVPQPANAAPPPQTAAAPVTTRAPPPVSQLPAVVTGTEPPPPAPPPPAPAPAPVPPPPPTTQVSVPEPEEKPPAPPPVNGRKEVTWEDLQRKATVEAVAENGDAGSLKDPQAKRGLDTLSMKSSDSDVSDVSAMSSVSRLSSASYMSVQSERARGSRRISRGDALQGSQGEELSLSELMDAVIGVGGGGAEGGEAGLGEVEVMEEEEGGEQALENDGRQSAGAGSNITKSSSVGGEMCSLGRNDDDDEDKKRRSSFGAKMAAMVGLGKKSQSTSQLDPEEEGKKKKPVRLAIQRSVETGLAIEFKNRMTRQPSRETAEDGENPKPGNLIFPGVKISSDSQFTEFLDGLGPAQLAGRQTLATPPMGDIQIGMVHRKERLDVEVIRARGLVGKPGNKQTPAPYVKVYLLDNGKCINKKKTRLARKTLDPLYQQQLQFEENPEGKVLQIIVWGDYGRMDHKSFMGAAQILLDDLELTNMVIGWYKLFPPTSLVDPTLAPLSSKPSQSAQGGGSNVRS
ncbi:regulating synaptic membrane exocytosis protein 2 isoform X6 [Denticeps clupeoides]|uniref:regulating synaptic membrane exocytosis protein 2 isoform X6 n=1 Tax=Denticeps clupeoides TaxID=299321 RepID=UPI0010A54B91|nr:regulating synaptic membrane exocytosis protein 2-like isoform X6 [Denticeps clupeoides]